MPFLKRGTVLKEKVDFILSKLNIIPHFMSFETQLLTRPITAGYNCLSPFHVRLQKSIHFVQKERRFLIQKEKDLHSKNHPDSVHFFNIVQETIVLGMLRNLARRKKFSQEYINRLTDTKEHESEKATEIKPLSTTDMVESLFGSNTTEKGEK